MHLIFYTLTSEDLLSFIPKDFDFKILSTFAFIETLSSKQIARMPYLECVNNELKTALFFAESGNNVIVIGEDEIQNSPDWELLKDFNNVKFCNINDLEDNIFSIIMELI